MIGSLHDGIRRIITKEFRKDPLYKYHCLPDDFVHNPSKSTSNLGSLTSSTAVINLNKKYTSYNAFNNYDDDNDNNNNDSRDDNNYTRLLFPHTIPYLNQEYLANIGLVSPVYYHHHHNDNDDNNNNNHGTSDDNNDESSNINHNSYYSYSNYAKTIAETVTFGEDFKRRVYAPFDLCPRKNLGSLMYDMFVCMYVFMT